MERRGEIRFNNAILRYGLLVWLIRLGWMLWLLFGSLLTFVLIWKSATSAAENEERRQRRRVEAGLPPRDEEREQGAMALSAPGSPLIEDRVQLALEVSRLTMEQLQLEYGPTDTVMKCIVNPKVLSATFTVSCLLREKLKHFSWNLAEYHLTGYVIVKDLSRGDARPLHGKVYEWNEEKVSFWNVVSIRPLVPDPKDVHGVKRI